MHSRRFKRSPESGLLLPDRSIIPARAPRRGIMGMRRFLAPGGGGSASAVLHTNNPGRINGASPNNLTYALGYSVSVGDFLIVALSPRVASEGTTAFSDSGGNVWTKDVNKVGGTWSWVVYSSPITTGGTLTLSWSSATAFNDWYPFVLHCSGLTAYDQSTTSDPGFNTSIQTGSVTTTGASDVVLTGIMTPSAASTACTESDSGFTTMNAGTSNQSVGYKAALAAGTYNPTWAITGGSGAGAFTAAYK